MVQKEKAPEFPELLQKLAGQSSDPNSDTTPAKPNNSRPVMSQLAAGEY